MEKTSPPLLFDPARRDHKLRRAQRLKRMDAGFLAKLAADTLSERIHAVNRPLENAMDLESLFDFMAESLAANDGTKSVTRSGGLAFSLGGTVKNNQALADTDENSLDLVTSVFGLHWHNNLPATLEMIRQKLKPDGLFLAAMPGDRTLNELRSCFIEAETEISGSVSLRVDPFGEVRQYGSLLQRTGFALPVVDSEVFTVRYDSIDAIVRDLRSWGGSSSLQSRPAPLTKQMVLQAGEIYRQKHADADGRLRATYEIVYLHGWKPHSSQQKPLKPGSATTHLSKVLGDAGLK